MSQKKPLVDFIAEATGQSTAESRKWIVLGKVKVNDQIVDDPATRLSAEKISVVEHGGVRYSFQP